MDNSLREAMIQMVNLQAQQLNVMNQMNSTMQMNGSGALAPNASALTSYTNYAAPYQGPPNPFAPPAQQTAQFRSYASQIAPGGFGDTLKQYINTPSSQISPEQKQMMTANLSGNLTNTAIAGTGAVLGGVGQFASMMIPGVSLLGSIGLGAVAGGLTGAVTSVALDQAQQAQAYNKYLLQNSYRFINPLESTNDRGIGGFGLSDRQKAGKFMRNFDVQSNISDKQTMELLQTFTEGDLLKSTSDLKTFEKKFTQLTEYVKTASVTLNTSFKQTASLMAEMEKRGILSQDFDYYSSSAKTLGSFTGQTGVEAMQSMTNTANTMTGSGSTTDPNISQKNAGYYLKFMDDISERGKQAAEKHLNNADAQTYRYIASSNGPEGALNNLIGASQNAWNQNKEIYGALFSALGGSNMSTAAFEQRVSGMSMKQITDIAYPEIQRLGTNLPYAIAQAQSRFGEDPTGMAYALYSNYMGDPSKYNAEWNLINIGGMTYDSAVALGALQRENTPANRATYDAQQKRIQELDTATSKIYGVKDIFRNTKNWVKNQIGNAITPGQRGWDGAAQWFTDLLNGGAVTPNTLSDVNYSADARNNSFNSIEKATKNADIQPEFNSVQAMIEVSMAALTKGKSIPFLYGGSIENDVADIKKQIKAKMKGLSKSDPKYSQYKQLLGQYNTVLSGAEGMEDAGRILTAGMGAGATTWWNLNYNKDWSNMSVDQIQSSESGMVDYVKSKIRGVAGNKEKVDKFLDDTQLAGLTGREKEYWENQFKTHAGDDSKLTQLVEQIMTDLNKSSNNPNNQKGALAGVPGQNSDTTISANQVIVYGTVTDNSKVRNDGSDTTNFFGGIIQTGQKKLL